MAEKKKKDETIEEAVAEVTEPVGEVEVSDTVEETPEPETQEPGSENQIPEVAPEPEVAAEPDVVAEPEAAVPAATEESA